MPQNMDRDKVFLVNSITQAPQKKRSKKLAAGIKSHIPNISLNRLIFELSTILYVARFFKFFIEIPKLTNDKQIAFDWY
jgi:hypothetical protein